MNPLLAIGIVNTDMKKYLVAVFIVVMFVIMMPALAVFSLGSDVVNFLVGSASAESAAQQGLYMGAPVVGDTYAWGNCTYWAFAMRLWADKSIPTTWGNANTWDDNAVLDGYVVDYTPAVGAVMQTDDGLLGHVAYVTDVDITTGQWKISEMNAPNLDVVSSRTFAASSAIFYNFIHDKKVTTP